ncbi:MAG: PAS domain-containing protein, partial [Rhodospirillaceae bacterium]|nr:PAS domain-containing protein [Rhodospirillaceae bacterium]
MALALSALVLIGLATNIAVQAVPWLWIVAGASVLWIVAVALIWSVLSQPPTARQSLEAITAIFDSAPGPRFVTDEEGAVVYANPSGADWLDGVTPLDRFAALAAPEYDGEEFVARLGLAAGAGLSDQVEIPLSGEMPEPDWFQVLIRPLESLPNFLVWSLEDITARKAINDILSRERQDLADFLDFMPTGVYSVDVDGAFHYVNQRFAEWLGRSAEELVNLSLDDVLAGASRPDLDGEWQGRVRFQTAAGDAIDTLVFQSTYDDAGVTRTRSLVMRDVKTDIERSEGH